MLKNQQHGRGENMSFSKMIMARKSAGKQSSIVAQLRSVLKKYPVDSVMGITLQAEIDSLQGTATTSSEDEVALLQNFISEVGASEILDLLRAQLKAKEKSGNYHLALAEYAKKFNIIGGEESVKTAMRENPLFIQSGLSLEEFAKREAA